jgi:hypothetical protein
VAVALTGGSASATDNFWTLNGNGNWSNPANWDANGVPNTVGENAIVDQGDFAVTATVDGTFTIGNLTVGSDDTIVFGEDRQLAIRGTTVTNDGLILLNDAVNGTHTNIEIDGMVTFSGSGTVRMAGSIFNRIHAASAAITDIFINASTHTIEGGGKIGGNNFFLNNEGLIDANIAAAAIEIDPFNSGATDATNTGTLRASNGGILRLLGGDTFDNTGGTIEALTGSVVEIQGNSTVVPTTVVGGTLSTAGSGVIRTTGGDGGTVLQDITVASGALFQFGANLNAVLRGTITNNGTVEQSSAGPGFGEILLDGDVLLTGTGVWTMNNHANNIIRGVVNGVTLTNDTDHTIQGSGDIGSFSSNLINNGTIIANQATPLQISSPNLVTVTNNGTLRATNGATLNVNLGVISSIDNQGTVEALNGSNVTYAPSAGATNNMAGVLTGGTWRAVATGGGATVTLRGSNITQLAAGTTVELSGAGSVIQVVATSIDSTLATNAGTLKILDGRTFAMTSALANSGTFELGGAGLTDATLNSGGNITNSASGVIFGHGTISDTILNSGTVRASGGMLVMQGPIDGQSGTIQSDASATLFLANAGGPSDAEFLTNNGTIQLGGHNILVTGDYTNANFGTGNSFNPRANVIGSGQINASPGISQTLGGNVTNGGTATATMAFGNVHVGDSPTKTYIINNQSGAGPSLRGAIQTAVNGGNLTDARLIGSGVTASNFGPLAPTAMTPSLEVTFNATSAGALNGQQVRILNNFDNVSDQILQFTGAAYRLANPTHSPEPVNFGIIHVGDAVSQALTITNNLPIDGFSERLDASIGSPTGSATTNSGTIANLAPGSSNNSSLVVGISTATAGMKTGTATISFVSDGTGSSGLGNTNLPSQIVNIQAQVNNYAVADVVKLSGSGSLTMTGPDEFTLDLGSIVEGQDPLSATLGVMNDAAAPADSLAGSFMLSAADFSLSGFSPFTNVAAGATQGGLVVSLDDSSVGDFVGEIRLQPQSTNPRPFSQNLDEITIQIIGEVRLGGDYNLDGAVNAADYTVWRNSLGQSVPAGTGADGSGPTGVPDGTITRHDYTHWKSRYGATAGSGGAVAELHAVPEAASHLLAAAGCMLLAIFSGRSCGRGLGDCCPVFASPAPAFPPIYSRNR